MAVTHARLRRLIRLLRLPLLALILLAHILLGTLLAAASFWWCSQRFADACVQTWSRVLLYLMGIRLHPHLAQASSPAQNQAALYLINHISWIDVFVVAAVVPVRFVAKSEVGQWPLIGWLAHAIGTVFIERGRRHAVSHVNETLIRRLALGDRIGVFPEGTTTDGSQLLRFHSNLVHAAIAASVPVVPVALQYRQAGRVSDVAAYIDDMTLFESIGRILLASDVSAHVHLLPALPTAQGKRQDLADEARAAIAQVLNLSVCERDSDLEAG